MKNNNSKLIFIAVGIVILIVAIPIGIMLVSILTGVFYAMQGTAH